MAMEICEVSPEGIGEELGLLPGDDLFEFNGRNVRDLLDYIFFDSRESFFMSVKRGTEILSFDIEKDEDETLGLQFSDNGLKARSCQNRCIFCFVDQLPKGMRKTLYVKDDDYRHSLIYGNYVTLTNLKPEDMTRILEYGMSPLYVSVHTTDPDLRRRMLRNRRAGEILEHLKTLTAHGIRIHAQIVMCPGWNDGEELLRTLRDLAALSPELRSVAIVPLGMTEHRKGLEPLAPVTEEIAAKTLDDVADFREKLLREGNALEVWCSDEFYIRAGREIPRPEYYGDFAQIEDGVGILSRFELDLEEELQTLREEGVSPEDFVPSDAVSGVSAFAFLSKMTERVNAEFGKVIRLHCIENHFFGKSITVSGLLTGQDLNSQLTGKLTGSRLVLPRVMLRDKTSVFLDDMTVEELARKLNTEIVVSEPGKFLHAFLRQTEGIHG